jgi:hypothetical protein
LSIRKAATLPAGTMEAHITQQPKYRLSVCTNSLKQSLESTPAVAQFAVPPRWRPAALSYPRAAPAGKGTQQQQHQELQWAGQQAATPADDSSSCAADPTLGCASTLLACRLQPQQWSAPMAKP